MITLFVTDVITIEKTGENFRLLFDIKGRFTVHRISPEESSVCYHCAWVGMWWPDWWAGLGAWVGTGGVCCDE